MSPGLRRLAWFVGLWAGGVVLLAGVSGGLRLLLGWAGLTR